VHAPEIVRMYLEVLHRFHARVTARRVACVEQYMMKQQDGLISTIRFNLSIFAPPKYTVMQLGRHQSGACNTCLYYACNEHRRILSAGPARHRSALGNRRTWYKYQYLLLTMGSHHTKRVCMVIKFVSWRASEQYFHHRGHYISVRCRYYSLFNHRV
jgi:hypothetical protein